MKYNIWNKWDPLKVCMLGNNYAPEFFNGLPNKVATPLKRICEETLEDLEGYKNILQDFGVDVIQPSMDPNERFLDGPQRYPRGPLQPRDYQLVLGNKCYGGMDHPAIGDRLREYGGFDIPNYTLPVLNDKSDYDFLAGSDWPSYEVFLENRKNKEFFKDFVWEELLKFSKHSWMSSAQCFMIGTKLFIGIDPEAPIKLEPSDITGFEEFDIQLVNMDGHSDANFHPIKPGAILSLYDVQTYSETFPGWEVCYLPDQGLQNDNLRQFKKLKRKNDGKWWLIGEEDNDEFTNFVESWLQDWVGYVEETVFDVNVLMLDEHHCCVSQQNNEQVNAFLKKHNIEPVYIPWRHRFFWDGGLHCITLDLVRG